MRLLDYTNPMQGRKWLRYVLPDPVSGLRIAPNLALPQRVLGFSLRTNVLGLRGPANVNAAHVVLGTSFGMGFAVDDGSNWYELCLPPDEWLNLSLPVGVHQINALFNEYYRGQMNTALVIYHPNFWQISAQFERWQAVGGSLFDAMGWQTDYWKCLRLHLRRQLYYFRTRRERRMLKFKYDGALYKVDALYNRFNFEQAGPRFLEAVPAVLHNILLRFQSAVVVRVPLKQELVPEPYRTDMLNTTVASHLRGWELMCAGLRTHPNIRFVTFSESELGDFHPQDTHWNARGNRRFAELIRRELGA